MGVILVGVVSRGVVSRGVVLKCVVGVVFLVRRGHNLFRGPVFSLPCNGWALNGT